MEPYITMLEKWQSYWEQQKTPRHRFDTEDYYQSYALELRALFEMVSPKSVLEIGCGNGALYEYLGFDQLKYRGIDFSSTMLEVFAKNYPGVNLICKNGAMYHDQCSYDLIFSNGVIQYFDQDMLQQHFHNAKTMMKPDGLFICASVPWKSRRIQYHMGEIGFTNASLLRRLPVYLRTMCFGDSMGYWYSFKNIEELAARNDFSVTFYGCMHYLYRFHAVMQSS